tara:strand:+ start:25996 stop:26238 length:243 start_codon:yes stop_codon:yes gene_type:complete
MSEIKKNTFTWVALVLLIILNTIFAENGMQHAVYFIVTVSSIKFLAVVYQFIEAKHAHAAWKALSILFVAVYVIGILVLY